VNTRAPQKRRLETRARLIDVATGIVDKHGYSALRVEDVVEQAGVAKGTLFSHFTDKNGLLAVLIGARVMDLLDDMDAQAAPDTIAELNVRLAPLVDFVAQDRLIFDILLRYSGSTGTDMDEVVTQGFLRQITLFATWLARLQATGQVRNDQPAEVLAEGIQAFVNHVLALSFCAGHAIENGPATALEPFLLAWLGVPE
jgi:AcrR family transcriptional regulator